MSKKPATRFRPARHKAARFLLDCCSQLKRRGETVLPTVRELSARCGVSCQTMLGAAHELRERGVLRVTPRMGLVVVADCTGPPRPIVPPRDNPTDTVCPAHERVADELCRDILSSRYERGVTLPTLKELCVTYSCGSVTMKKALLRARGIGAIRPKGRGYAVAAPRVHKASLTVAFIAKTMVMQTLANYTPRSPEFWREIERRRNLHDLNIAIRSYYEQFGRRPRVPSPATQQHRPFPQSKALGYVLYCAGLDEEEVSYAIGRLSALGKPVAVIDDLGEHDFSALGDAFRSENVRFFSSGVDVSIGRTVGRFLLSSGHRSCAFFGDGGEAAWMQNRYRGIAETFGRVGDVHVFDLPRLRFGPRLLADIRTEPAFRGVLGMSAAIKQQLREYDPQSESDVPLHRLFVHMGHLMQKRHATSLFHQALAHEDITAWVGVNDAVACMALQFLQSHKVHVPGRISVCGIDDSFEAIQRSLTSCSFNVGGLVAAIFDHLLQTPISRVRSLRLPGKAVVVDGRMMVRETTRTVRRNA